MGEGEHFTTDQIVYSEFNRQMNQKAMSTKKIIETDRCSKIHGHLHKRTHFGNT